MKAAVIHEFGDYDVLKHEDVETPRPGPGQVVIKVLAAGVNRLEHYLREGSVVPELAFPHILGTDAAGEVAEVGEGVHGFNVGDRVLPMPGFPQSADEDGVRPSSSAASFTLPGLGRPGTYAQFVEIPSQWVVKDETGLSPEESATLPMVVASGVRAVKIVGEVAAGDSVLIHSGASGTGSMQIQIAKALGARVATTVRGNEKSAYAATAGADLVIDTRRDDFVQRVREWTDGHGADVVIDSIGGDVLARSIDAVKPLGIVVAFGFVAGTQVTFDVRDFFFAQKQLRGTLGGDIEDLKWGLEQVQAGRIRPLLDQALPLSRAAEAHRLIATNQVRGNIALLPWSAS